MHDLQATSTSVVDGPLRGALLARVRGLFRVLALLLLVVELVEWVDAGTPVFPERTVAAVGLLVGLAWTLALHRTGRPTPLLDVAGFAALAVAGWGLGRPGAVLAMLLGSIFLRSLYGSRRSVLVGLCTLLAGYVVAGGLADGVDSVLAIATVTITVGIASFGLVIRSLGEVLARHDLASAWDEAVATAEEGLLAAADRDDVGTMLDRLLDRMRSVDGVAGGLVAVPTVPSVALGRPVPVVEDGDPEVGAELRRRLEGLLVRAELAVERLESERRYRDLAEGSRDGIYLRQLADEGELLYLNQAASDMLPQLSGARPSTVGWEMVKDADVPVVRAELDRHGILAEPVRLRLVDEDGEERWIEVQEVPFRVVDGEVVAVQGMMRDVTAQQREEEALVAALTQEQQAAESLRRLDDLRATFLAAVSHELRTPLAALLGSSQTLAMHRERLSEQQSADLALAVQRQADRLSRLLDDLLDVERLSRGRIAPRRTDTDLLAMARRVVDECHAPDHPIEVVGQPVVLRVDEAQIERVVDNLLRNAIRHTPLGTRVVVEVAAAEGGARLVVEDDGPGIPTDERDRLWAAFEQGDGAAGAPSPGTGIGLSLVRSFVELHGGSVHIATAVSGGARFEVHLPRVEAGDEARVETASGH